MRQMCLIIVIIGLIAIQASGRLHFKRKSVAYEYPYYQIILTLGSCKDKIIYSESKVWGHTRYNRVLDIYFKSEDPSVLVSKAEIILLINNTNIMANSEKGVGNQEFGATVFLPADSGAILFYLTIYACNGNTSEKDIPAKCSEK
ncbi:uncharacterized protein LOC101740716 [Bombyx mori]|uniref:Uncharacterized protein n=1 Tax=Bombyx mori TaxID=7091 RepID=A0A8R2AFJ4_BOMMO|nr:uncharacterized protein LOC101740716 [Bombyx mori]